LEFSSSSSHLEKVEKFVEFFSAKFSQIFWVQIRENFGKKNSSEWNTLLKPCVESVYFISLQVVIW
jgi:hypothetical protein